MQHEIHSHVSRWFDPTTSRTRILLRGPTYGATIIWDESAQESRPVQRVWRTQKRVKVRARHPYQVERQLQSVEEETRSPTPGANEPQTSALRRSTRRTSSPFKRPIPSSPTRTTSLRRSSRRHKQSQRDVLPSEDISGLISKESPRVRSRGRVPQSLRTGKPSSKNLTPVGAPGSSPLGNDISPTSLANRVSSLQSIQESGSYRPPPGQASAWNAGRLAAEFPDVLAHTMEKIKQVARGSHHHYNSSGVGSTAADVGSESLRFDSNTTESSAEEYGEFWSSVGSNPGSWSPVGVWHPTARADVEAFMTAYCESRTAAQSRLEKLAKMRELQEQAREPGTQITSEVTRRRENGHEALQEGQARKRSQH